MTKPVLVKTGREIYLVKDRDTDELLGEVERYSGRWHAYPMNTPEPIGEARLREDAAELLVQHRRGQAGS